MKQDDILQLTIEDVGAGGEGIAHRDGATIFVPFALQGEVVKVKVNHVKRGLVFADIVEVLTPSPMRVYVPCNRYRRCGGCDLMHVAYEEQLNIKRQGVATTLAKAGLEVEVAPTRLSPNPLGYRNKIMLPFGRVDGGKTKLGFFREGSHRIVPIGKCFLHGDWAEKLIAATLNYADKYQLSAYDPERGKGLLRHLVARQYPEGLDVTLVVNGNGAPHLIDYYRALTEIHPHVALYVSPNTKPNNVILGSSVRLVAGSPIVTTIDGVEVSVNPLSFLQVNDGIRKGIYDEVRRLVGAKEGSVVIDAFAGVGVLGATMAKQGAEVHNIEIVPEAIADADELARLNGIEDKVHNHLGDSTELLPEVVASLAGKTVSVILDPPRKGCPKSVLETLLSLARGPRQAFAPQAVGFDGNAQLSVPMGGSIDKLIYISCNPATLARDLAILEEAYSIESVTPWDMFPQTKHCEVLVQLSRKTEERI